MKFLYWLTITQTLDLECLLLFVIAQCSAFAIVEIVESGKKVDFYFASAVSSEDWYNLFFISSQN